MNFTGWFEPLSLPVKLLVVLGIVVLAIGIAAGFVSSVARLGSLLSRLFSGKRKK